MPHPERDESIRQRVKSVQFMNCTAGKMAKRKGQPVTILTFAHEGEIDPPMALSISDTKALVVRLLSSLAAHDDDYADAVLDQHFRASDGSERWPAPEPPSPEAPYVPPPLPRTPDGRIRVKFNPFSRVGKNTSRGYSMVTFTLYYPYHVGGIGRDHHTCYVISGYQSGDDTYVLFRIRPGKDGCGRVLLPDKIVINDEDEDRLPDDGWEGFLSLRDGEKFRLSRKTWTKLSPEAVGRVIKGRTLMFRSHPGK
jgi:hypothetical protein